MDKYTPSLLDLGLKGMIGKGRRSDEVSQSIVKNKCVYFGAVWCRCPTIKTHKEV